MSPVALFLIAVASIFLVGSIGEAVFKRTNIPDVVWLIIAGIVIGPISGLVTRGQLVEIAPYFAALTLVVILFEGGSQLQLAELSTSAGRSGLLALLTFLPTVALVAVISMGAARIGWLPDLWTWQHGILLGCILGGSSSIIIMPAMLQAGVEPRVANLVNLESAFTDAFCVVSASALIRIMVGTGGGSPAVELAGSFGIALVIGGGGGLIWLILLRPLASSDHAYPITLSALMLLYVAIQEAGGSAALGILAFAIVVGNARGIAKKIGFVANIELRSDVRGFHTQVAFIIKSFFFTFIGAMLSPPWSMIFLGVLLGLMLLVARAPGAMLAMVRSPLDRAQRKLVLVSAPRGMAAGVLATLPATAGIVGTEELPTLVFAAVLTSILLFAVGFPLARRMLPVPPSAFDGSAPAVAVTATEPAPAADPAPSPAVPRS